MVVNDLAAGWREFHIARELRDRYQFDASLFAATGNVVLADVTAARIFAERMNVDRDSSRAVRPGEIGAMGLIDEISHLMFRRYRQQVAPTLLHDALGWLAADLGPALVEAVLERFCEHFPPVAVYRGVMSPQAYLAGASAGEAHREAALEELLMLWLANQNPAFRRFGELFDDGVLDHDTGYRQLLASLLRFLGGMPAMPQGTGAAGATGAGGIIAVLRAPALAAPDSLEAQVRYIAERWGFALDTPLVTRLLSGMDVIREEGRAFIARGPGGGPAHAADLPLPEFGGVAAETEQFSPDRDWMPRLVLLAKNAFVWLDQLSRQYGRSITRLDQIPDAELDTLAARGFTGLWLIGLWQRSRASQRIKQIMGNPDAVASAYSLDDYTIAHELGGAAALDDLRARCARRGVRLASDMVPNHVGIDGRWVIEHPEWFIRADAPPFGAYRFTGPDLSPDGRVAIQIEDHYYDHTDAAVVFRRVDRQTGATQYLYHGNDGTSMPWNDTAQLNYLDPVVRETVIQTILHVARQFPIIRFDAAMTLARRHVQRLWFPEPGTGGDIPSRAAFGMSKADFDAAMPNEFWREVVDRCAVEAPDTLLLAEAFWMMEGYFVRTLGMHRVYNSAFMVMLRDEDNARYRQVIKNTLEFDREVLRRYVNFMNNPDERTAVDQFGKDGKYFGVATLLATLPGLPMFGHGQVEGFTEKYGMEFRRAYREEHPDGWLIARHERQIFPLLHRRAWFAGVEAFLLYDCRAADGTVHEDVFAYSNRYGEHATLVLYHNRFASVAGWIHTSAAYAERHGDETVLVQQTLADGLGLRCGERDWVVLRELVSGLEYLRHSRSLRDAGLFIMLDAYACQVFDDIREVSDHDGQYAALAAQLDGAGVPSVAEALRLRALAGLHAAVGGVLAADLVRDAALLPMLVGDAAWLAMLASRITAGYAAALRQLGADDRAAASFAAVAADRLAPLPAMLRVTEPMSAAHRAGPSGWLVALAVLAFEDLGRLVAPDDTGEQSRALWDGWALQRVVADALGQLGVDAGAQVRVAARIRWLLARRRWMALARADAAALATALADDRDAALLLGINRYEDVLWFDADGMRDVLDWLVWSATLEADAPPAQAVGRLAAAAVAADYRVTRWLAALGPAEEIRHDAE